MIAFQPQAEAKLKTYDRYVDEDGKTTLHIEEQMAARGFQREQADKRAKQKAAAKNKKNMF
jgi:hypothetical protein